MPNIIHRLREARATGEGTRHMLVRQCLIATRTWPPTLRFALILHALIGSAFLCDLFQHKIHQEGYEAITGGNLWIVGLLFLALCLDALLFPVWGGLVAIVAISALGLASALITHSVVGVLFYLYLPYFTIRATRHRQHLLTWVQERRVAYEERRREEEGG